jgi:hypothetical protein
MLLLAMSERAAAVRGLDYLLDWFEAIDATEDLYIFLTDGSTETISN